MKDELHWFDVPTSWNERRKRSSYHWDNKIDDENSPMVWLDKVSFRGNWKHEIDHAVYDVPLNTNLSKLLERNSVQELLSLGLNPTIRSNRCLTTASNQPLIHSMIEHLGIKADHVRIHKQLPGDQNTLHMDTMSQHIAHTTNTDADYDQMDDDSVDTVRVVVALNDWQWGHFFQLGNRMWYQWDAGDVVHWDWKNLPHSTANAGHVPRYVGIITGRPTDKFWSLMNSKEKTTIWVD
jgi:hypothetical protein